jgi:hypothetical protein
MLLLDDDLHRLADMVTTGGDRELHPFFLSPKGCLSAALQEGLGIELPEDIDQTGEDPRPSRLVAGAEGGAIVAME